MGGGQGADSLQCLAIPVDREGEIGRETAQITLNEIQEGGRPSASEHASINHIFTPAALVSLRRQISDYL